MPHWEDAGMEPPKRRDADVDFDQPMDWADILAGAPEEELLEMIENNRHIFETKTNLDNLPDTPYGAEVLTARDIVMAARAELEKRKNQSPKTEKSGPKRTEP